MEFKQTTNGTAAEEEERKKMPHKNVDVVHRLIDDERKFASIQFFGKKQEKKDVLFFLSTKNYWFMLCMPFGVGNINSFISVSLVLYIFGVFD